MKIRSAFPEKVKAYLILGSCVLGVVAIIAVPYFITLSNGFLVAEVADEISEEDKVAEDTGTAGGETAGEVGAESDSGVNDESETADEIKAANNSEVATSDKAPATQPAQTTKPSQVAKPEQPGATVPEEPEEDKLNVDDQMSEDGGFTEVGPIENADESAGEYTPSEKPEDTDSEDGAGQAGEAWGV